MSIIDVVAILPYYIGLGITTENDDVSGKTFRYATTGALFDFKSKEDDMERFSAGEVDAKDKVNFHVQSKVSKQMDRSSDKWKIKRIARWSWARVITSTHREMT